MQTPFAVLLLIRSVDKILSQLLYFQAIDAGLFTISNVESVVSNNKFGFLVGFWNVLWWVVFSILCVIWLIVIFTRTVIR